MNIEYPIFLLGYMCSGKSSLGKKLAKQLEVEFIDLDHFIEKKEGSSISEIFRNKGEEYFRKAEAHALRQIAINQKAVIALGGGTPCFHENMPFIKSQGSSIFLNLSIETIIGRLKEKKAKRPLIAQLDDAELSKFVKKQFASRLSYYEQADFIISSHSKPKVDELLKILSLEQ